MDIGPGDEIVTSDDEHPGPDRAADRRPRSAARTIRAVPFAELADAVGPSTTLVACSHVNWRTGEVAPAELAEVDVPVILDGAQGAGAVPVDVRQARLRRLRRGGPEVAVRRRRHRPALRRAGVPRPGARDRAVLHLLRGRLARLRVGAQARRPPLRHAGARPRGRRLQPRRARRAARRRHGRRARARPGARGRARRAARAPTAARSRRAATRRSWRGRTTTPRRRASASRPPDIVVRNLPGTPYVRASVGAWSSEDDLDRLLAAL